MAVVRTFFNRLFQPILHAVDISPLFSDPEAFSTSEFPRRSFPLEVRDWRNILVFLYTYGDVQTRKHADQFKIVGVSRYAFKGGSEHQIIVVEVELRPGIHKLLRIERDTGVKDVERDQSLIAAPALQDSPVAGPSMDISQKSNEGVEAAHPSISIYSSGTRPGMNAANVFVDTVQITFKRDIRDYTLVDYIKPSDTNLHHLALLVAEVQSYTFQVSNRQNGQPCVLFASLIMGVVADIMETRALNNPASIPTIRSFGGTIVADATSPTAMDSNPDAFKQIHLTYQGFRTAVDRQIKSANDYGNRPTSSSQLKKQHVEHAEYVWE